MKYQDESFSVAGRLTPPTLPVRVTCRQCGVESVRQLRAARTQVGRRRLVPVSCLECGWATLVEPPEWEE